MADPISLVGLTAGLVSLGLQASGGIVKYLDALECREEDIASVRQQNASLDQVLRVVGEAISRILPEHQASTAAVQASLDTCKRQLNALNALVVKLAGSDQPAPATGTPVARVKRHGTRLLYPFRRQKIEQLAERLRESNTALQLALQALSMTTTQSLQSTSYAISSTLVTLDSKVTAMSMPLQNLHDGLPSLQTQLDTMESLLRQLVADAQRPSAEAAQYLYSNEITGRLVRKPDVLRKFCDTARVPNPSCSGLTFPITRGREQFRNIVSSLTGGRFGCSCWPLTLRQRKDIVWGSLAVHFETSAHEHSPGCPFAGAIDKDRKQHLRVEFTGLRRLLNVAVQLSFAAKSGAGGWSISPDFTYYPTVDEHSAPAFRILEWLRYATVMNWRLGEIPDQWMTTLAASAVAKLVVLFQSRKASPLAVDSRNRSLVHYMTNIICRIGPDTRNWEILLEVLNCLVAYGAPAHDYDLAGNTPLVAVTDDSPGRCVVVADILLQSSKDIGPAALNLGPAPPGSSRPRPIRNVGNLVKVMSRSAKVAEAYGCGPLTSAILAHDLGQVEHLLKHHPAVINERNILGHAPLHVAVPKPLCLSLLVRDSSGYGALLNERGPNGWSALEMALRLSGSHCRNGRRRQRCRGCRCARSVTILLQADCAVPMLPRSVLAEASYLCKLRYIRHMKNRRERLKRLGLANLSTAESRELGLLDQRVLDSFAPQVVRLLQQRGIHVPASLLVDIPDPSPQSTSVASSTTPAPGASPIGNTSVPRSVYEELNDVLDAELFLRLGFRDTDILQHAHLYFPTDSLDDVPGTLGPLPGSAMEYMHWLAEHGADFISHKLRSFGSGRGWFAAHATFSRIGESLTDWTNKASPLRLPNTAICSWIRELHAVVLRADMADACKCRCSLGGCTPLKYLYLGLRNFFSTPPDRDDVTELGLICAKYLENFSAHYEARHHAEAVRHFTFEALALPHTCTCYDAVVLFREDSQARNCQDSDEIEDEHAHELEVFEELVREFEGNVRTILQDTDQAIPGIVHFWKQTWVDRVCETLEYLEGGDLSDGEKRAAEEIGVVWHEPQSKVREEKRPVREQARKMEEEEGKGGKNPFRDDTLEYWIYQLEKIAPN